MIRKEDMGIWKFIFFNGLKKTFTKKNVIGFIVIAFILQMFLQVGKYKYLSDMESKDSMQKIQEARVAQYVIFRQYSTMGISLMLVPSQFSILYNDSTCGIMISNVNVGSIFNIYLPKKGKEIFSNNSLFMNFWGISLLLIFYFGIVFGIDTTLNIEYLKFLVSFSRPKTVFSLTVLFRVLLLNIVFFLLILINIAFLFIDNINLFHPRLFPLFWGAFLVITVAFSIGCILGRIKNHAKRSIAFFLIYIVIVILLPMFLNFITMLKAETIKPVFEFDYDNLKVVMAEEDKLIHKHGILEPGEIPTAEMIRDARQSIFDQAAKINENEELLKRTLRSKIKNRKFISSLFPVLLYLSISEDVTTNGSNSFLDFYTFSQQRKKEFTEFCVEKIYPRDGFSENNRGEGHIPRPEVVNFIKGDEDIFIAQSKLPEFFWQGSIISLLWITGLLIIAYRSFSNGLKGKTVELKEFDVDMHSGEFNYLLTANDGLKDQVYNYLRGEKEISVQINIDEQLVEPGNFIYLYNLDKFLCHVDCATLQRVLFSKETGSFRYAWQLVIRFGCESGRIIVMDKSFVGLKIKEVKEIIKEIKKSGARVLYMGENIYEGEMLADNLIFSEGDESIEGIKAIVETVNGGDLNTSR